MGPVQAEVVSDNDPRADAAQVSCEHRDHIPAQGRREERVGSIPPEISNEAKQVGAVVVSTELEASHSVSDITDQRTPQATDHEIDLMPSATQLIRDVDCKTLGAAGHQIRRENRQMSRWSAYTHGDRLPRAAASPTDRYRKTKVARETSTRIRGAIGISSIKIVAIHPMNVPRGLAFPASSLPDILDLNRPRG
jgi:hypothetical protein